MWCLKMEDFFDFTMVQCWEVQKKKTSVVSPTAPTFYSYKSFWSVLRSQFCWTWPGSAPKSGTLLNLTWLCTKASQAFSGTFFGTLLNLTWLCTKASQTFSGTFSGTLLNLTPRPSPEPSSKPCWTWPGFAPKPPRPSREPSPEPCWTWPGSAPKPPRPSPEPSPEPCWTWPGSATSATFSGTSLNLTRHLHQCTPELFWAEDPISLRCSGKNELCADWHNAFSATLCFQNSSAKEQKKARWTHVNSSSIPGCCFLCVCWKLLSRFQSRSTAAVAQRNASLSMSMPESNTDLKACPVALWPDFLAYAGGGGVVSPQQIWIFCRCILRFDSFCIRFVSFLPLPASCLLPPHIRQITVRVLWTDQARPG